MSTYFDWNKAICEFLLAGLQANSYVFMSIDDDAIQGISFLVSNLEDGSNYQDEFLKAVREFCVQGNKVKPERLLSTSENEPEEFPRYVAFLATTVYAAHLMGEQEQISANNYFNYLNRLLGIENADGRTPGLATGEEEKFWLHWQSWLLQRGFLSSAKPGRGGTRYINYPISQALLRHTDKGKLIRLFADRNFPRWLNEDALFARVFRSRQYLTKHLIRMLTDKLSYIRADELKVEIFELFQNWLRDKQNTLSKKKYESTSSKTIYSGIYRQVNPFSGELSYYAYPKQPRRVLAKKITFTYKEESYTLVNERPGWFRPLQKLKLESASLTNGINIPIDISESFEEIVFPKRDFWMLVQDPDAPGAGLYGTWTWNSNPDLGQKFILLCKTSLTNQLEILQSEGIIAWKSIEPIWDESEWVEFTDMMVISQGWGGVRIPDENLLHSLKPNSNLGVQFDGGIRINDAWVCNYHPNIIVSSFYNKAKYEIVDPLTNQTIAETVELPTNQLVDFSLPNCKGTYLLIVNSGPDIVEKRINIIEWADLQNANLNHPSAKEFLSIT